MLTKKALETFVHQLRNPLETWPTCYVPEGELCRRAADVIVELQGERDLLKRRLELDKCRYINVFPGTTRAYIIDLYDPQSIEKADKALGIDVDLKPLLK